MAKCRGCDGKGFTITHWSGTTKGGRRTGGVWRNLCDRCYGTCVQIENRALFRQRVGKGLAAFRERMGMTVFQMADRLSWDDLPILPLMIRAIERGETPPGCAYPDGLVKRIARDIYRHDERLKEERT